MRVPRAELQVARMSTCRWVGGCSTCGWPSERPPSAKRVYRECGLRSFCRVGSHTTRGDIRYGRCDMLDTMHLVGTHERSALVETSRLWAGAAAAAAADATRVEGGARRARRPSR